MAALSKFLDLLPPAPLPPRQGLSRNKIRAKFQQNGPAEVQCEFFSPDSGVNFLAVNFLGVNFRGALFIGKHRTKKFDPRIRPQNSGLKNSHPRIRPQIRVHEVQNPLRGNLPLTLCEKPLKVRNVNLARNHHVT